MESAMNLPADLKYTEHDEWVRADGDVITVGITDYAQDALGELVHVELPKVGDAVSAGDPVCEVESVKAVAEVYSPCDGEVVEVNEALDGDEESVNNDPYGAGWLFRIQVSDAGALAALMSPEDYAKKIADS
jgi:glycine cleavage system H protein